MYKGHSLIILGLILALSASHSLAQNVASKPALKDLKSVDFVDGETGVESVVFVGLEPRYDEFGDRISEPVSESDLMLELRRRRGMGIQPEKYVLDREHVENTLKMIKEYLSSKGYFKANVTALGEELDEGRMKVIFSIEKGQPFTVSGIVFKGIHDFSNDELIDEMKTCLGDRWGIYDLRHVGYCAQKKVRALMQSRGHWQAKIDDPRRRFIGDSVELTLEVNEGPRYRLGEVKVTGAEAVSDFQILGMFGQQQGDVADGTALQDLVYEKLKRVYHDKGYVQFDAEFEPTFVPSTKDSVDPSVNVDIMIEEGRVFKVKQIAITIEDDKAQKLIDSMTLKAGEAFSRTKLENDIKKINDLDEFQPIDLDRDVEFRTDEERAELVIVIKTSPLDSPQ